MKNLPISAFSGFGIPPAPPTEVYLVSCGSSLLFCSPALELLQRSAPEKPPSVSTEV